ncbi:hypothetical protein VEx25_A1450 [Vibrio antiquarius]|jgi:hypothetical protein|uniref:Uncharacterized protein n=2 Tax=Vibrio antiquarius (strain Ex25) TaxID=150340 RepID=A0ACA6QST9_VIBAE|nr:hypothetical protein VEA_000991 [Vibrio antiquarius]EDN58885.1 hypothetical protein VEx25_A1450 [Vibrio antiquarius]EMD80795.1 hypothetical protein C408_0854 [Vibrio diabolicus E0666]
MIKAYFEEFEVKKSEFPEEKLAKSIQNECNNMSQSINHQKGQKVVYS